MPLDLMTLAYRRKRNVDTVMDADMRGSFVEQARQLEAK